jgi:hypothetical protein
MEKIAFLSAAVATIGIGAGMAFYEWSRIKAGRPILKGSLAIQLYWVAYFSMFVLGVTFALAAMFK